MKSSDDEIGGGFDDLCAGWSFSSSNEFRRYAEMQNLERSDAWGIPIAIEHRLPFADGEDFYAVEHCSIASWLRSPRRAVIFLNGSVFRGNSWSIPVAGYNAVNMVTERAMFAWTFDMIGTGNSFVPQDGLKAGLEANVAALKRLIRCIVRFRNVPEVDLVGEGFGGIMAIRLSSEMDEVRSCTLTNTLYKDLVGGPAKSPEFVDLLKSAPRAYFEVPVDGYDFLFSSTPEEVKDYVARTQPGIYPTPSMLLILQGSPFFDPSIAKAPGLVIYGSKDIILGPDDARSLARDYGSNGATLSVCENGGHALRLESRVVAEWFWGEVFDFLEP